MGNDSLGAAIPSPVTVRLAGKDWTLHPWRLEDYAEADAHIRSDNLQVVLDGSRHINLPEGVRGKAIAEIVCRTITPDQALIENRGRMFLLWRSLARSSPGLTLQQLKATDEITLTRLGEIVMALSGFKDESAGPLESSTSTTLTPGITDAGTTPSVA